MRIAVLDDYQDVARGMADWAGAGEAEFFHDPISRTEDLIERLKAFDVIVAMRERTPFPRALLEQLPKLRLLVTTGMRNRSIDVAAHLGYVTRESYRVYYEGAVEAIRAWQGGAPIRLLQ
jgi:phosphoglycerate dehydrogenase-like enzyme